MLLTLHIVCLQGMVMGSTKISRHIGHPTSSRFTDWDILLRIKSLEASKSQDVHIHVKATILMKTDG